MLTTKLFTHKVTLPGDVKSVLEPLGVREFHGFSYCLHPRLPVPVRVLRFLQMTEYFHEEFLNSEVPFFRLERNRKHVIFDITRNNPSTSLYISRQSQFRKEQCLPSFYPRGLRIL